MITLQRHIDVLRELGLPLLPDMEGQLDELDPDDWREWSFDELLLALSNGTEDERAYCDWAHEFDLECIYDASDYVDVAERLCELAGAPNALTQIRAELGEGEARIEYKAGTKACRHTFELIDDWMDGDAVDYIGSDIETVVGTKRFYMLPGGQSQIVFCMSPAAAERLRSLGATI
jgi:hypothetical protein